MFTSGEHNAKGFQGETWPDQPASQSQGHKSGEAQCPAQDRPQANLQHTGKPAAAVKPQGWIWSHLVLAAQPSGADWLLCVVILSWRLRLCDLSTGPAELPSMDCHGHPYSESHRRVRAPDGGQLDQRVSGSRELGLAGHQASHPEQASASSSEVWGSIPFSQVLQRPPSPLHPNPTLCSAWRPHPIYKPCLHILLRSASYLGHPRGLHSTRDRTRVSCIGRQILYHSAIPVLFDVCSLFLQNLMLLKTMLIYIYINKYTYIYIYIYIYVYLFILAHSIS